MRTAFYCLTPTTDNENLAKGLSGGVLEELHTNIRFIVKSILGLLHEDFVQATNHEGIWCFYKTYKHTIEIDDYCPGVKPLQ